MRMLNQQDMEDFLDIEATQTEPDESSAKREKASRPTGPGNDSKDRPLDGRAQV
jgi:hypothetical protein